MSDNPHAVDAVFCEAVEIESAEERAAFVERACGGDAELKGRVQRLLDAHFRAGSFLEPRASGEAPTSAMPAISEGPGTVIGRYKLLQQIGEGGFGVVFMAEQVEPIRRKVAIKIIKPGMDTKQVIARFEAERQALALMDHPNIAKVFDAGATDSGRPYFVMELVRGIPITDYCDQGNLTPRERLELFLQVCRAVQHAHQKGIVHRDIKPSNVLVTLHDGTPTVKVIDFGISKALDKPLTEKTLFTEFGQMIGTPLYMSPEQADLSFLDVDTRTDIYSLGVLLYELLTGATPFDRKRIHEAAYDEVRRIIREEEPPRPSKRLSTLGKTLSEVSSHRKTEPAELSALMRGDLDWIVMRAMEKDRTRRYTKAEEFAADIERHLSDQPVMARPPSVMYRMRKFVRRNKLLAVSAGIAGATMLIGVMVGGLWTRSPVGEPDRVTASLSARVEILKSGGYRAEEAKVLRELLERKREVFGPDAPETWATMGELAQCLGEQGQLEEAFELCDAVFDSQCRVQGKASQSTISGLVGTGCWGAYDLVGGADRPPKDLDRARDWARRVRERAKTLGGPGTTVNPLTVTAIWIEAWVECRSGNPRQAIRLMEPTLEWFVLPPWCHSLALFHWQAGDSDRSRDWFVLGDDAMSASTDASIRDLRRVVASSLYAGRSPPQETAPEARLAVCDRLVAAYPNSGPLCSLRGVHCARLCRWDRAAADLRHAVQIRPTDASNWYDWGIISLYRGDVEEYRKACREILARFAELREAEDRQAAVHLLFLGSSSGIDARQLRAIQTGNRGKTLNDDWVQLALYRCGDYGDVRKAAVKEVDVIVVAMAEHQLKNGARAKTLLAESRQTLLSRLDPKTKLHNAWSGLSTLEPEILLREAEQLIEPGKELSIPVPPK